MSHQAKLRVRGRVQGVFYRKTAEDKANSIGLSGWVRNMPDGSVESLAYGTQEQIEVFITWCKQGPSGARVDSVDVEWLEPNSEDEIKPGFAVTW